jgi:phosphoglycolate phosphatase-like HAD superfamily hydrolase
MARVAFTRSLLARHGTLFWDFDGVIKESVAVKTAAFERLFAPFGTALAARVREHHERNGGMSRFEKIPLYLRWAERTATPEDVDRYCTLFSTAVRQAVIDSQWVPGAREYLQANHARQRFVLVTATPQAEIDDILGTLQIAHWFCEVHGAPTAKEDAIASVLARWGCPRREALAIGDSESDRAAAVAAGVDFLLRRTVFNQDLQRSYSGPQCEDFVDG